MAGLSFRIDAGVPAASPCLDGHFPGNPVVPGAVLLGILAARLAGQGLAIARVERMKFRRILRPDTPFEIELTEGPGGTRAAFRDADGLVAEARLRLRPADG